MHIRPWEYDLMTVAQLERAMAYCDKATDQTPHTPDAD